MLNNIGTTTIETKRLILRQFKYEDSMSMLKNWISDERIQFPYLEPVYTTQKEVEDLLNKYIENYKTNHYYRWAIILKDNNECIGQIAYFQVDIKNNFVEIEYCIGADYQGKGLATEATKAIIEYGFEKINLHKIQICHRSTNSASQKVIEKSGFSYEGALRDYFYINGEYEDRVYYSILENEFKK